MGESIAYYCFDFDDNLLIMSSKMIIMNNKNEEVEIDTHLFSKYRGIIGKEEFIYNNNIIVGYPLKTDGTIDYDRAYRNFMDSPDPNIFLNDVKEALQNNSYGPVWNDFIECLINGSLFSIITARGHSDITIRNAIEYIINNILSNSQKKLMYKNLLKFSYLFKKYDFEEIFSGIYTENLLVKKYLDKCEYIGVSTQVRGGFSDTTEEAKGKAITEFKTRINNFGKKLGVKVKIGFSDDDLKNIEHIKQIFDNIDHEKFSNIIQYTIKNTNDPNNIVKTIRDI